jgi:hypothetical protein
VNPKASSSYTAFQPLPSPVDQQFNAVDRNLCSAFAVIETSRQNLYDCRATVTDLSKRCGTYEQSYKSLCPLYEKVVNDLHKMANKNLSLHQDLEGTEQTVQTLETRIRDLENEKSKMMGEHESALADGTNRLNATERKIEEMEKTRWTTESQELDLQVLPPEPMVQAAPPELIWSPSTGEVYRTSEAGHEENDQQQGGPPKKSRKRKQGSNAKARDA